MAVITCNTSNAWLGYYRPVPQASVRLFCFPYSGAGASIYYPWATLMPANIEVCPVELPGRGARMGEAPFTEIGPLVESIARGMLPYFNKPFAFFGHSMGALVSFELTRLLQSQYHIGPTHIFVSGHHAPQLHSKAPVISDLPEAEFVEKIRELDGTQEDVLQNSELRAIILPILRADFSVCEKYAFRPGDKFLCPIDAFGGLEDKFVTREDLDAWRVHTAGKFCVRMLPGNHFFLHASRQNLIRVIAQELTYPRDQQGYQRAYV